jgi:hypothetical protein
VSKQARSWTIEVLKGLDLIGRYQVPLHRLERNDVADLLKALVAKYDELGFEEVVDSFLNKRKGGPQRFLIDEPKYFAYPDKASNGYWLFGPTISVCARFPLSPDACDFIRKNKNPVSA